MAQIKKIKVDAEKIQMAIQAGIPLTITTYTLPFEMENYITDVLTSFLSHINQSQMTDSLCYCIKELVNNAKKANTKRVYFEDKKLDLTNPSDYEEGMKNFKQDTINNIRYYLERQRKEGYYIKVLIQTKNNKIKIEIRNRAELTVFEYKRIHDKITRAQQYSSVEEGISQLLDDSEGAGLGLVILILILRKVGLTEENFQVLSERGETITRMILPFNEKLQKDINDLSKEFIEQIEGLPEFPENITHINRLINDENSKMSDIAMHISNDVALTGELLKMVNSAAYSLSNPCQSITEAVKIVGLRGIRNLLFSIGSMKNLVAKSGEESKKMWNHSYQVAFYAYNLAKNFLRKPEERSFVEDSYVCGLLHDMGKIIFVNANIDTQNKMFELCKERGFTKELFETLISGMNHSEVGALIAKKWNFPDNLVNVIRYHHNPEEAPENLKRLTGIIYLSDLLARYSEGTVELNQISTNILELYGINTEDQLEAISKRLSTSFANSKQ